MKSNGEMRNVEAKQALYRSVCLSIDMLIEAQVRMMEVPPDAGYPSHLYVTDRKNLSCAMYDMEAMRQNVEQMLHEALSY